MLARSMARTISIVGAGRVGTTLGRRLCELEWKVGAVVTRSPGTARAAVRAIGAGVAQAGLTPSIFAADVVLLATPDGALAAVAEELAAIAGKQCRGKIVLHTSGALDRTVLAALEQCGASTGSLHPMQTFSGRGLPRLDGVIFAVEGDRRATRAAQSMARALGGAPVAMQGQGKPAYHAAGALVAGYGLGLVEAATQILMKRGFTRRRAVQALLPLMRQMLDNFEKLGPQAAWTGPLSRADFATIEMHMRALRDLPVEFPAAYAALARLSARVLSKDAEGVLERLGQALQEFKGG
jgi:predicted short-subunit dehydrogenase-like oxidoreductase (DUF2520 family)